MLGAIPYAVQRLRAGGIRWRGTATDDYVRGPPTPQAAVDLFRGQWSSRLPIEGVRSGEADLFSDTRVTWAVERLGGVDGKSILELGPLEGGHTTMLAGLGAAEIVAVEGNSQAYLRCLVVKELLELKRCAFLLGDFVEYLKVSDQRFDVCWASGVLYHQLNPVELLSLLADRGGQLFVWTQYYDAAFMAAHPAVGRKFRPPITQGYEGFSYECHPLPYGLSRKLRQFCGGANPHTHWMKRHDILSALRHFGWCDVEVAFDTPTPHGPSLALCARRPTGSD